MFDEKGFFSYNFSYPHLKFWVFWILKNFSPLLAKCLALKFLEGPKNLAYCFKCYFWAYLQHIGQWIWVFLQKSLWYPNLAHCAQANICGFSRQNICSVFQKVFRKHFVLLYTRMFVKKEMEWKKSVGRGKLLKHLLMFGTLEYSQSYWPSSFVWSRPSYRNMSPLFQRRSYFSLVFITLVKLISFAGCWYPGMGSWKNSHYLRQNTSPCCWFQHLWRNECSWHMRLCPDQRTSCRRRRRTQSQSR